VYAEIPVRQLLGVWCNLYLVFDGLLKKRKFSVVGKGKQGKSLKNHLLSQYHRW